MSAQINRVGGEIALNLLRLTLLATAGTLVGVMGHIVWQVAKG